MFFDYKSEVERGHRLYLFLASGAGAGALASLLTNALDIVKLRLQVQRIANSDSTMAMSPRQQTGNISYGSTFGYRNLFDGLGKLVCREGVPGLFRGVGARMAFHAPMSAFGIALFEGFRIFWQN